MRAILPLIIVFFVLTGCGGTFDNAPMESEPALSISLASTSTLVPVNAQLILHASTALEPSTVNESSVYIQNSAKEHTPAYITLIDQDIIVQPKVYLAANTGYELIVSTAVASAGGAHLRQNAISTFTSGGISPDTTSPTLITTLPLDKSSNIEPYSKLYFQFSESISPLDIGSIIINVYDAASELVSGSTHISGSLLSFTPDSDLTDGTNYTVELNTSSIFDLSGNPYTNSTLIGMNFTVGISAPLVSLTENPHIYSIGSIVNCIETAGSTLFIGSRNGLDIITYDLGTSMFTSRAHLTTAQLGIVYSVDLNSSTHRAYVGSSTGFTIIDITDIGAPVIKSHYSTLNQNLHAVPVYGLEVKEGHAYLAATTLGIIDLDISNELLPQPGFVADTGGTAFDVIKIGSSLAVSDYDQGTKMFDLTGSPLTAPTPQAAGQDRNLFSVYNAGSGGYDYFVSSGIGGIKYWDSFNGIGLPAITTASYVSKIIPTVQNGLNAYANVKGVGIASFSTSGWFIQSYQLLPFDIMMIGYIDYSSLGITAGGVTGVLLAADSDGLLHSYEIQ